MSDYVIEILDARRKSRLEIIEMSKREIERLQAMIVEQELVIQQKRDQIDLIDRAVLRLGPGE